MAKSRSIESLVISGVVAPEVNTSTAPIPNRPPPRLLRVTMASDLGLLAPFVAEFLATYPAITIEIDVSVRIADLIGEKPRRVRRRSERPSRSWPTSSKRGMAVCLAALGYAAK